MTHFYKLAEHTDNICLTNMALSADIEHQRDITQALLKWIQQVFILKASSDRLLRNSLHINTSSLDLLAGVRSWFERPAPQYLTITLTALQPLDDWFQTCNNRFEILSTIMYAIEDVIRGHCVVVLKGPTLFYLEDGQSLPADYCHDEDIIVDTRDAYRAHTATFSYQLSKALLRHHRVKTLNTSWNLPLQSHAIFMSASEAAFYVYKYNYRFDLAITLRFGSTVSIVDLDIVFKTLIEMKCRHKIYELNMIFYHPEYDDAGIRQHVFEQTVDLIKRYKCRQLLHVFLLTQHHVDGDLISLAPETSEQQDTYSVLKKGIGYYLSHSSIGALTRRYIQEGNQTKAIASLDSFQFDQKMSMRGHANAYIIRCEDPTAHYRMSKRFDDQALRSQVTFTMTHQYAHAHHLNQDLNQQQELSQATILAQRQDYQAFNKQSLNHLDMFNPCHDSLQFDNALAAYAQAQLKEKDPHTKLLQANGYLTDCYYQRDIWHQLALDPVFRLQIVRLLYGRCYRSPLRSGLSQHSFVWMHSELVRTIACHIAYLADGLDPQEKVIQKGLSLNNMSLFFHPETLVDVTIQIESDQKIVHSGFLTVLACNAPTYQSTMNIDALVREDELKLLPLCEQAILKEQAYALLQWGDNPTHESVNILQTYVTAFISFYCPKHDLTVFHRFLSLFQPLRPDYLKIILQLAIQGYRPKIEQFLALLDFLDDRALLHHFYAIYFQYADTTLSVFNLLQRPIGNNGSCKIYVSKGIRSGQQRSMDMRSSWLFLDLAQQTHFAQSQHDWQPFEKFGHHFLVFAAKHNLDIHTVDLKYLSQFWSRVYAKILIYSNGSTVETDAYMTSMVQHLIHPNGFDLAPFRVAKTLFIGLEQLIEHAIQHRTLAEQLSELGGLSLLWTDALYAINHGRYKVVSKDMFLKLESVSLSEKGSVSPFLPSAIDYDLSLQHLKNAVMYQPLSAEYDLYIAIVFRYLGCESLRDALSFYRNYFTKRTLPCNVVYDYFQMLLLGYVVLTKTGEHYTQQYDQASLYADFLNFLKQKDYCTDYNGHTRLSDYKVENNQLFIDKIDCEYRGTIMSCVVDFCEYSRDISRITANGRVSLWTFYQESTKRNWVNYWTSLSYADMPAVFKKSFDVQDLGGFMLLNKADLLHNAAIFDGDSDILWQLLEAKITEAMSGISRGGTEKKRFLMMLLKSFYPDLSIAIFINDWVKLQSLIDQFGLLAKEKDYQPLSLLFKGLLAQQCYSIDTSLMLLEVMAHYRSQDSYNSGIMVGFLMALLAQKTLLTQLVQAKALINLLGYFYFEHPKPQWLPILLRTIERLLGIPSDRAVQTLQTILNHILGQEGDQLLVLCGKLSGSQLQALAGLLATDKVSIAFVCLLWTENNRCDFLDVNEYVQALNQEHASALILLAVTLHAVTHRAIFEHLDELQSMPYAVLSRLVQFIELGVMPIDRLIAIVSHPSLLQAIIQFERELYSSDLNRFQYDTVRLVAIIAQITLKSSVEQPDLTLSSEEQAQLLDDFQRMMSYMSEHPVLIEKNQYGQEQSFTIHELTDVQFPVVFKQLSSQIQAHGAFPKKRHAYRLMLVALACEALYRSVQKFPQDTQILCVLHGLRQHNLIQEVKTGGGKSIISELYAPLLYAEDWTVDIVTENDELADTGLRKFKRYYQLMGMRYAPQIIEPNSVAYHHYTVGGINHSTPANLVFFRAQMALQNKSLPSRVALLCDEIDAVLTTTVQYRLAATLDPIYLDLKSWEIIYTYLLAFIQEEALFIHNTCDKEEDVHNFKNYVLCHTHDKKVSRFLQSIPHPLLDELLDSARVPATLTPGEDYLPIQKKDKKNQYAAPILMAGTKRPAPNVSYGKGIQPLLHMHCNMKLSNGELSYGLEVDTETLMVMSAKNFFDFYRLQGGSTIGFTGTPGSKAELKEFVEDNGLVAYQYPIFHPDLSEDLGVMITDGITAQHTAVLTRIRQERATKTEQPMLIITDVPRSATQISAYLTIHATDLSLQSYNGYESIEGSEKEIVRRTGSNDMVTVATQSLSRGADFETNHAHGLFAICCASDLTENEWLQIVGRVARNGKPGQFCAIINSDDLLPETADIADPRERFYAHRQIIGLRRQQERLKNRLLEDVRHFVVNEHFLKLKTYSDNLWGAQYGFKASLIPSPHFLSALRDFNKDAEEHYMALLGNGMCLHHAESEAFINARAQAFQHQLDAWFPDHILHTFQAIEPLIPLEHLQSLPALADLYLKDMSILSEFLASGWRYAGHQPMQNVWLFLDNIIESFQPYLNNECSLLTATVGVLETHHLLDISALSAGIGDLQDSISGINAAEIFNSMGIPSDLRCIAPIETVDQLQHFVINYLAETVLKINSRRWDELSLPDMNVPWVQNWLSGMQTTFTAFGYLNYAASFAAGPIPFVIHKFMIPFIAPWVKSVIKRVFASSESDMLQILAGLDDVLESLGKIMAFLTQKEGSELTVNDLLENIAPLFKNKAILTAITQWAEQQKVPNVTVVCSLIPEVLAVLESYRMWKLKDIHRSDLFLTLLLKISSSQAIIKLFGATVDQSVIDKIQFLSPLFFSTLMTLSATECIALVKVLAHPTFSDFINTLPQESQFKELVQWLRTPTEQLPSHLRIAFHDLRVYQADHGKIAQAAQQAFRATKSRFKLTPAIIQTYLSELKPKCLNKTLSPAPEQSFSYWTYAMSMQWQHIVISYVFALLLNYLLFQFSVLLLTLGFVAAICLPIAYQYFTTHAAIKDEFVNHIAPPLQIDIMDEHAVLPCKDATTHPSVFNVIYQRLAFWPQPVFSCPQVCIELPENILGGEVLNVL